MLIESLLLVIVSVLLSGIGASFFHEGCAHTRQSDRHDRVVGFAALLVSVSTLAIGWSRYLEGANQSYGSASTLLTLLSLLWPVSFVSGWFSRRVRTLRQFLVIVTGALSTVWLIAHDNKLSASDLILALGLIFWLASFALASRRRPMNSRAP